MAIYSKEFPFVKFNEFELLSTLNESRLFRHDKSFDNFSYIELSEMFYLSCLLLCIVSMLDEIKLKRYIAKTLAFNNFNHFRITVSDLYLMAYILLGHNKSYKYQNDVMEKSRLSELDFKTFLALLKVGNIELVEKYFYIFENSLRIKNGTYKIYRRKILNWYSLDSDEKERIISEIVSILQNSDLIELVK